jgi:hypothetical protein
MRVAAIFVVLLLVLLPIMGLSATGDGTLRGRMQTFVSYAMSLTSMLLCLLTVIVSIYTLTSDVVQKQIYTVLTKPIRRQELLLGKLLGVVILDLVLLLLFSSTVYSIATYMPAYYGGTEAELTEARNEFLTARKALVPAEVDVSKEVAERYAELLRTGRMEEVFEGAPREEILAELTNQERLNKRAATPGQELIWEFQNVRVRDPNGSIFVRFKYDVSPNPPDERAYGTWFIGDYRYLRYGTSSQPGVTPTLYQPFDRKDPVRTFREIEMPADAVAPDGYVAVVFYNDPMRNNTTIIFPLEDGLELLYKADSFTANFARGVLLIFFRLFFLACLGVFAATFLSFPVALLLCIVVFFTASFSGFVIESFDYLSENMSLVYSFSIKWIVRMLPQLDKINPNQYLVPGRLLGWNVVGRALVFLVMTKAVLLLLLGVVVFKFREIAKVIV